MNFSNENMTSTDVLFVTSSSGKALQFSIYPYLGVGYLSNLLKQNGFNTALFDTDLENSNIDRFEKFILKTKPLIVGFSIMSISLPFFYRIVPIIRKLFPGSLIVAGGPHVTNNPEIISELSIDYGFIGQSEECFIEFVKKIKNGDWDFSKINGMIIPSINRIDKPSSIDVSKFESLPDYTLYDIGSYRNIFYGKNWFTIITSRGCPFNCKFCKDPGKNKYKEYPLTQVQKQILFLVKEKKCQWISFVDDTFTFNRQRVIELCNWIITNDLKFKWTCCTRADTLDEDLIDIMQKAGLSYVIIGVEAGSEKVREQINKNISTSKYISVINYLKAKKIRVLCSYILGNPGETYFDIKKTINFNLNLKADYAQFYLMTALPNSPIFFKGLNENVFDKNVWTEYMRGNHELPYYYGDLDLKKLKKIQKKAFLKFYLRPKYFFDLLFRLFNFFVDTKFLHFFSKKNKI